MLYHSSFQYIFWWLSYRTEESQHRPKSSKKNVKKHNCNVTESSNKLWFSNYRPSSFQFKAIHTNKITKYWLLTFLGSIFLFSDFEFWSFIILNVSSILFITWSSLNKIIVFSKGTIPRFETMVVKTFDFQA